MYRSGRACFVLWHMRYLIYSSLLILVACGSKKPSVTMVQDSIPVGIKQADFGHYHLAIQPRKEGQSSVLILYDRTTHQIDSVELVEVRVDSEYTHITNVTKTIGFDKLALIIDWQGDSDHMYSELVGYMG